MIIILLFTCEFKTKFVCFKAAFHKKVESVAYGMKVFRGEALGEHALTKGYKADWRLVPRDQEASFISYDGPPQPTSIVPKYIQFPPLFEHMMVEERRRSGRPFDKPPMLELKIKPISRALFDTEVKQVEVD